jgi:hypothetical protein
MQLIDCPRHDLLPLTRFIQPLTAILQRILEYLKLIADFEVIHHPLRLDSSELISYLIEYSRALALINEGLL